MARRDSDTVNFAGVTAGGGPRAAHLPEEEGPYKFRIVKGEKKTSENSNKDYINWQLVVDAGKYKGKKLPYHMTSLSQKALFNLRGMMEAAGIDPGDSSMKVPVIIKRLTGKTFLANVEDDEYEGKVKSVISEYVVPEDDDDDVDDEDEEDEEEEEEEEKPARKTRAKRKPAPVEDDEDEDEEEEEEDEEEEEESAPKRRATARSSSKATASSRQSSKSSSKKRKPADDDDDDDEDLDDIDLDDL